MDETQYHGYTIAHGDYLNPLSNLRKYACGENFRTLFPIRGRLLYDIGT